MRIALLILLLFMQALANDTETGVLAGEVQPLKSQRLRLVREDLTIKVGEAVPSTTPSSRPTSRSRSGTGPTRTTARPS